MQDIIGFLTINQWLAVVRIGLGLWWLKSFLHKPHRHFVSGQMVGWTVALAENHPVPAIGRTIKGLVEPNASWFPYLILVAELAVGIGLIFGLLTPLALIVAIFLNLNYLIMAGVRPKDINVNKAYQCEQGQNWNMIVPQLALLAMIAVSGCTWSLDHALGLFCAA